MSRRPSLFRGPSTRGSGTGGVFSEHTIESDRSDDDNNSEQESEPQSEQPPPESPPPEDGPTSEDPEKGPEKPIRRPWPLWAKLCACISLIIAIILIIVLSVVLTRKSVLTPSLPDTTPTATTATTVTVVLTISLAITPTSDALPTLTPTADDTSPTTAPDTPPTATPSGETPATDTPPTTAPTAGPAVTDAPPTAGPSATDALPTASTDAPPTAEPSVGPSATVGPSDGPSPTDTPITAPGVPTPTGPGDQPTSQTIADTASAPSPTFVGPPSGSPTDTFQPPSPQPTVMRPDRPRLIAPPYRWPLLTTLIASDPYLQAWDGTIVSNADQFAQLPPVSPSANETGPYDVPGEVKIRIKTFAYAYRRTSSDIWVTRTWTEILNILNYAPVPSNPLGPPYPWQLPYFIDWYELTSALAIAYDWLFEVWSAEQRQKIESMIIWAGLSSAIHDFGFDHSTPATWTTSPGQKSCVSNAGILMRLLAIWDTLSSDRAGSGIADPAQQVFAQSLSSATSYCASSVSKDRSWIETPSAGLAGATALAELAASFLAATGGTYGLMTTNPNFKRFGLFQIYASGYKGLFDYGDVEPTVYSTSGNSMMFYAVQYNKPEYMLFQRDRSDAADPWSMFWYEPTIAGQFWSGLPLDHYFDDPQDSWVSMRSSWTDPQGLFVAMKSGKLTGHSAKGDLDLGDFVIDCLGERWAVELGSGMTNATGYSDSEAQDSQRWLYYRKRTEGQNTILIGGENQNVGASPTCNFGSTNTVQGASTGFHVPLDSTAFFTTDISTAYGEG
ncbi:hypothetical protein FRC01_001805, partial [Tulasnella sp. 417]